MLTNTFVLFLCSCTQLDLPDGEGCSLFSLSVNHMVFNFTSKQNFSNFMKILESVETLSTFGVPSYCELSTGIFLCNLIFVPCNLTTGTPRPLCSRACYNFNHVCNEQYRLISQIAMVLHIPFLNNCKNTLHHLNAGYGYPNSSSEFEDDCFDLQCVIHSCIKNKSLQCVNYFKNIKS